MATIGIVWLVTSSGSTARRTGSQRSSAMAAAMARTTDRLQPTIASNSVGTRWPTAASRKSHNAPEHARWRRERDRDRSRRGGRIPPRPGRRPQPGRSAVPSARAASVSRKEVVGEQRLVVGRLGERLAVRPRQQPLVEQEARVALPLGQRLATDGPVLVAEVATRSEELLAFEGQRRVAIEDTGVLGDQQRCGLLGIVRGELEARGPSPPRMRARDQDARPASGCRTRGRPGRSPGSRSRRT